MTNPVISPLIPTQFPQYIQDNYPVFIQFIQDYYVFMEKNYNSYTTVLQSILPNIDIDTANENYLQYFQNTYPTGIPQLIAVDRRLFSKAMTTIYQTKGSPQSYSLLFKLLFNVDIEITFPSEQMLRVSDGKWVQNRSIRVTVTSGNIANIIGRIISTTNASGVVTGNVVSYTQISGNLYEIFLESISPNTSFIGGDIVSISGITFSGTVGSTIVGYNIINGGSGFTMGQILNVTTPTGSGSSFKVTSTNITGAITALTPISFGSGYLTNFYATLYPYTVGVGSPSIYADYTGGFNDGGTISLNGVVVQSFTNNWTVPPGYAYSDSNAATIEMILGAVSNYAGYYSTTDGFSSDINVLQDGFLYQAYSYLIKSSLPVNAYRTPVQTILHPAGTKMFGEFQITLDADLSIDIGVQEDILAFTVTEVIAFTDSYTLQTGKVFSDTVISSDSGLVYVLNYIDTTYMDNTYVGSTSNFTI